MPVDTAAAVRRLMQFLEAPGITGQEGPIGKAVKAALVEVGVPARLIKFDDAQTRIPVPTPTGNLIVRLPGTLRDRPRVMFSAHLDTVPLCAGAKPRLSGKKIVNDAAGTALGGDNRTGCGVLVTLAAELIAKNLPHPPITLLFTVREESGLHGARHLDPADLDHPTMGFNYDGRSAGDVIVGAVGADRWEVDIRGKAAHAGVAPEKGVSATMILALALAEVRAAGMWGKVTLPDGGQGTSNVGVVGGPDGVGPAGDATNVVTDFVHVKGESRSHDPKVFREITAAYKEAFAHAAATVTDDTGKPGKATFRGRTDYLPFRLKDSSPVVQAAAAGVRAIGREPVVRVANGGLDANWFVKHGVPTVTFGAGQNAIHTIEEWVDLAEYEAGCKLAVALATAG